MDTLERDRKIVVVTCVALALVAVSYIPGLAGPFLFDDFTNLDDLGKFGAINDWKSLLYYLTSGTADPTGRPVALLSFLIDAQDWPADPWPFKRTNLLLHIFNMALVWRVVARLQKTLHRQNPSLVTSPWTPVLAATFWGAHPLFVSTTLYVVQREAMLAATFVLLSILAWGTAVDRRIANRPGAAWAWAIFGFGGLTLLAGLSKANGFLSPLLAGLAYFWCFRPVAKRREVDRMAAAMLGLPSALILLYLVHHGWTLWSVPHLHGRDWTVPERLMSQPRALWGYVYQLLLPRAGGGGLYLDDFIASRGWFDPITTLPAILALIGSIAAAVWLRRRYPIATLAWLFFLTAHLLESSVVALELYFEHRNYLPAVLLGWPVAHFLLHPGMHRRYRVALALFLVAALLLLTNQRAEVWADRATLTGVNAAHRTNSLRSQVEEIQWQASHGHGTEAIQAIRTLQRREPASVIASINAVSIECSTSGSLAPETLRRSRHALETANDWNYGLYAWFSAAAASDTVHKCRGFGLPGLKSLVAAGLANPLNSGTTRRRDFQHAMGVVELAAGQPRIALSWFNEAISGAPDPDYALVQAAALGNSGFPELGVEHLDQYLRLESIHAPSIRSMRTLHRWLLVKTGYYQREINFLRTQMAGDAKGRQGPEGTPGKDG